MEFKTPSRRDDLIALCYLIKTLLRGSFLPGVDSGITQPKQIFSNIYDAKKKLSLEEIAVIDSQPY